MRTQGIAYAEVSFNPSLHRGVEWLDGVWSGRRLARERFGVEIAWLVELSREAPLEANQRALDLALNGEGVVGLGLVGDESVPAAPLAPLFARARVRGLGVMPHVGQAAGPASVREALDVLGADRIAHGITAVDDEALLSELVARGTCLCVAPSSNRKAGLRPDFARLASSGILLTANTDDPALVETDLDRELTILSEETGLPTSTLHTTAWSARFS